jgi:carbamoyltransferase
LMRMLKTVAGALGCDGESFLPGMGNVAAETSKADFDAEVAGAIAAGSGVSVSAHASALDAILARAQVVSPEPLSAASSVHVTVQRVRAGLAASVLDRVSEVLGEVIGRIVLNTGITAVGVAGSAFASVRLNTSLKAQIGELTIAPVPEDVGCALGAALFGRSGDIGLRHLGLGPAFSEQDIKGALDNCRLDYVYEPDWPRLFARTSAVLSGGRNVAWFQGAMDFGPRSLGSRSILCDPSSRYARENVNVYLQGRGASDPLPLSLAPSVAEECLVTPVRSPFMLLEGTIKPAWRDKLTAVVSAGGGCLLHTVEQAAAPELTGLLETHLRQTGVPGLINVPLGAVTSPLAATPKDAIQTTFSSAVDALVIGRFLVGKDYWLLRGQA